MIQRNKKSNLSDEFNSRFEISKNFFVKPPLAKERNQENQICLNVQAKTRSVMSYGSDKQSNLAQRTNRISKMNDFNSSENVNTNKKHTVVSNLRFSYEENHHQNVRYVLKDKF